MKTVRAKKWKSRRADVGYWVTAVQSWHHYKYANGVSACEAAVTVLKRLAKIGDAIAYSLFNRSHLRVGAGVALVALETSTLKTAVSGDFSIGVPRTTFRSRYL